MMAAYGIAPTSAFVWLPLVVLVNVFLAVAAAYAASLLGLWLRELKPFLLSFVRMLFFLSPGLVPLSETSPHIRSLLRLNPLTGLFEAYRGIFLTGRAPAAWELLYPPSSPRDAGGVRAALSHRAAAVRQGRLSA